MADRITESRARLTAALVQLLPPGRVQQYVPKQVVSPTIWIERHSWATTNVNGATVVALSWRIVAATDSDDDQAVLDEMSSLIYDAATRARFRPLFADFTSIDIGGMSTTALVVTVEENIAATTLCLPPQATPKKELLPA